MTKLLDHMKAMQAAMADYLKPEPYIARVGGTVDGDRHAAGARCDHGSAFAKDALLNDLIYMLDGPEQREAERHHETDMAALAEMQVEMRAVRDRLAVAQSDKARATQALGEEREIQNGLRDQLMRSEMNYAKLRGYLEGKLDSAPPVMVPQERMPFHATIPDANEPSPGGWGKPAWYHRS